MEIQIKRLSREEISIGDKKEDKFKGYGNNADMSGGISQVLDREPKTSRKPKIRGLSEESASFFTEEELAELEIIDQKQIEEAKKRGGLYGFIESLRR